MWKAMKALLLSLICNPQSHEYLLLLWGWTGPLFCHTRTNCFFQAELVLSSAIQGPTASLRLNWSSLLSYKYRLFLWGWTGPLFCHTRTYCFSEAELVLSSVVQVTTVSVDCLERYCLLSHKSLLLLWGWTAWSSLLSHKYLLLLWGELPGQVLPPVPQNIYCFFEVNCLVLSFVAQVPIVFRNCLVLSSVPQVLTASLMLNCLDRYCLLSRTISRSKVMSWLPAITTFSLWGRVPGTQVQLKMQSPTTLSLYGKLVQLVKKSKLNHDWNVTDW